MRLKIWWIMVVVAVVALALGGERCRRHHRRCKLAAAYPAKEDRSYVSLAAVFQKGAEDLEKVLADDLSHRRDASRQMPAGGRMLGGALTAMIEARSPMSLQLRK